jgi:hypothetical protein
LWNKTTGIGSINASETKSSSFVDKPVICSFLQIVAWLNVIGGAIGSLFFFFHQYEYQTIDAPSVTQPLIIPGIACIVSGIIGAILFWAISEAIMYLSSINNNVLLLNKNLSKQSTESRNTTVQDPTPSQTDSTH